MADSANRFFPTTIPSLKGKGKSTASQTAWAIIGLLAVCGPHDSCVERAIAWLVANQNENGTWDEDEFTGTGFPCVFYLKYHIYRNAFPLYALARYDNMRQGRRKFRRRTDSRRGIGKTTTDCGPRRCAPRSL